ncbi:MAG: dihydroorotate dehydrogenase [Spirochaetes bacterium]|nr:dihydroorotate dehydrogenase [Spirochaetota bacterium]
MDTSVKIGSLTLKNPITVASGTAGYGEELSRFVDISKIGAVFTKGLSMKPRRGNPGNRIIETPSGVLNSIGLENVGLDEFIEKKLPFLVKSGAVTIPNVAAHSVEENIELCSILSKTPGIDAIELNVSCPNVKQGGMAFGTDMCVFTELVEQAREVTSCPLIIKLSPNVTDIASFALRAEEIGADAVSAINTLLGMKIDIKSRRPHFANKVAGLSGPAVRPVAVRIVYQIYQKVKIPIVGMGGISNIEDVLEFIMAGASAVSIGTASMVEPAVSGKLAGQLEDYMKKEGISSLDEIRGAAHRV